MTLEELQAAIKGIRNPENYAEKYWRSVTQKNGILDMMERLIVVFEKMK